MTAVKPIDEKSTDLEDILDKFSIYNSYHLRIAVLIFLAFASNSLYCSNFIFVAENVNYTCVKFSSENNVTNDCIEWQYDNPDSFVAEFQLANQEWKRTLVGTVHSLGYMVGLLIVGPLSDRLGRKTTIVVTGVLGGVFGVARSFSHWYWLYIFFEFLEAAIGDSCSPAYILITEIVSTRQRIKFVLMCTLGYAFGGFVTALTAWLVPYWRTFLLVIYTPAFLIFFYKYLLDESPRWLLIKGNKDKAVKILEKAAKKNKQILDRNMVEKLSCQNDENKEFFKILKSTFSSKLLRVRFLVCLVWWTTSTFVNYGLTINSVSLQGNKYINYAILSAVDIPGLFVVSYILIYCKRKLPLMCCFFAAAILCVSQPFIPLDMPWLSITMYMAGKLMSSFYFNITYLYTSELFPTHTRNSMHALCSSLGRVGSIITPQTPLLVILHTQCDIDNKIHFFYRLKLTNEQTVHLVLSDPVTHRHAQHPISYARVISQGIWIETLLGRMGKGNMDLDGKGSGKERGRKGFPATPRAMHTLFYAGPLCRAVVFPRESAAVSVQQKLYKRCYALPPLKVLNAFFE